MKPVEIAVLLILAILVGRLLFATISGRVAARAKEARLRRFVAQRFPGARLTVIPIRSGVIGAELRHGDCLFQLSGRYIYSDGGDGFLHVYRTNQTSRAEIGRVSLADAENWYDVLELGLALIGNGPNQPPEPTR